MELYEMKITIVGEDGKDVHYTVTAPVETCRTELVGFAELFFMVKTYSELNITMEFAGMRDE